MTNQYYVPDSANAARPGQTVRSAQFNDNNNTIEQGFDLLPVPMDLFSNRQNFGISTADVANVYEVSIEPTVLTSYQDGMQIEVRFPSANTGPAQLNLNDLGVKQIRTIQGQPVRDGDIIANASGGLRFDLANDWWQLDTALSTTQNFANQAAASAVAAAASESNAAQSETNADQDAMSAAEDAARAEAAAQVAQAGSVPLLQPRQVGDGTTTTFSAPHTIVIEPQGLYVNIDGLKQRPVTDYTTANIGQIVFDEAPPRGAEIDITWFAPLVLANPDLLITSEGSTTPRALSERFSDVANVKDFGAVGDGITDDTAAIQASDDYALSVGGSKVVFENKTYRTTSQINKSYLTEWVGVRGVTPSSSGTLENRREGSTIFSDHNGIGVFVVNPAGNSVTTFNGYQNCIDGVDITGDYGSNPDGIGLKVQNNLRQLNFRNHWIRGFDRGFDAAFGGNLYFERVNYQWNKFCVYFQSMSDCFYHACHFGSGLSSIGNDFSGGRGIYAEGCANHHFTQTRLQVQEGGHGAEIVEGDKWTFSSCTIDQNGFHGILAFNCQSMTWNGCMFFDNGDTRFGDGARAGIQFSSFRQAVTPDETANTLTHGSDMYGQFVRTTFSSTGDLPTGILPNTTYWTRYVNFQTISLFPTFRDAADQTNQVTFSDNGTGTIYADMGTHGMTFNGNLFQDRDSDYQDQGIRFIGDNQSPVSGITMDANNFSMSDIPIQVLCTGITEFKVSESNVGIFTAFAQDADENLIVNPYEGYKFINRTGNLSTGNVINVTSEGAYRGYSLVINRNTNPGSDGNPLLIRQDGVQIATMNNNETITLTYFNSGFVVT